MNLDLSLNSLIKQVSTGDTMRDYQHATKLFVDSMYRLNPKLSMLFHVFVDINPNAASQTSRIDINKQIEIGMLAKTVSLPKFTIKNKTYNSYNRKNIVQDAINYEPINMTLHDDSANVVSGFWQDYYSYYFRDGDYTEALYAQKYKYQQRQKQDWGYTPKTPDRYLSTIRIYSLHQKMFSCYTLINPMITAFRHGDHTQGAYEPLQHEMTVAYEGVQYISGIVSNKTVQGFDALHYDNTPSPLTPFGGGTTSIFGVGGAVDAAGSILTQLSSGNLIGAVITGARAANNIGKADLGAVATAELTQIGVSILSGQNQQATIFAPTSGSILGGLTASATNTSPVASPLAPGAVVNMNNQNSLG